MSRIRSLNCRTSRRRCKRWRRKNREVQRGARGARWKRALRNMGTLETCPTSSPLSKYQWSIIMADFHVPELGEGVYEAEFVSWLVKEGDPVKRGQPLMEVLTDKATMEVPSPFAGTVTGLQAEPGQKVKVGQVVLTYRSSGAP